MSYATVLSFVVIFIAAALFACDNDTTPAPAAAPAPSAVSQTSSRVTTADATPQTLTEAQRVAFRAALVDVSIARSNLHWITQPDPPHTPREQTRRNVEALMVKIEAAAVGDTAAAQSLRALHAMLGSLLADAWNQPQAEPAGAYADALDAFDDEYQRFMREVTAMERSFIEHGRAAEAAANEAAIESAPNAAAMQSQREKQFLSDYRKQRPAGEVDEVVARVKAVGDTLTVHVTAAWQDKDVVFRHTCAQSMYITWTQIVGPARSEFARMSIRDPNGNEVGGTRESGMISIPLPEVWVQRER